ncbi:MAG: S23 ribosomal protein [Candidatus Woesebacteria bacterium GW2011_GWB1_39_10b]|uniref:S23 ribosomal protein n=2 Tax=Candidatus Woeseibacteriota TaxID=1752722 RepID=A0A0G0P8L1_9BACT|nr:MAG: S23 ribosomal protein [Microgenomates group bacterium GW2011_GWC1_38_12]KKQ94479.1 MAG: S23 ribosomal protein [Candidatus Woesebacteria bacterium GW2011_GWB1_39_10b]OGM65575.1 MAG: hypothetical protein A3A52_01720 [Candidatus Woesebacteria bacterium RIFCSPLOWO2_01_FULL_39_14]
MDIFRFRKFPVYLLAREFREELKKFTRINFPTEEKFVLRAQLWRALDSIALNIAEGSDHYSDVEFGKFLNTALTSLNEVVACLDCAFDDGYLNEGELNYFVNKAEDIARQLKAFSSKLRRK